MGQYALGKTQYHLTIGQLRPWHKSMARMMVAHGARPGELAKIFNMSPAQITVITSSPLFLQELGRLESLAEYEAVDVRTELQMRQGLAIQAIDKALLQDDANKAATVGFEVLDRTGYGKIEKPQKHLHLHAHARVKDMTEDQLLDEAMDLIKEDDEELGASG
jgi:hypothetical protein